MPNVQYPNATPVDEPVGRPRMARKPMMPMGRPKPRPVAYPDSVPVDEPASPMPRPAAPGMGGGAPAPQFKKGGKVGGASKRADGIAQQGKTKGRFI